MKKALMAILLSAFLAASFPSYASAGKEPTGGEVTFDIILVRPLGVVSMALGTAIFVVGLPFTIPTWSVGVAAKRLIVEPARFTFARPVGELREMEVYYEGYE